LTACGGAAGTASSPKLDIKLGGKDSTLVQKSGAVSYGNVISTAPGKPDMQTFAHTIVLANYEMDTTNLGTMRKPMTAPGQVRLLMELTGEDGTNEKSPFKVGTYDTKADKFNKLRTLFVTVPLNGKDDDTMFDTSFSGSKIEGTAKITAVTDDSISGEINVTEGANSIKGNFTAKLPKK
jgi:hypothetical protein